MTLETETVEDWTAEGDCLLELRDGTAVIVRPARAGDRPEVVEFVSRVSRDSVELRFAGPAREEAVTREILGSPRSNDRLSLLMETLEEVPRVVGNAEYVQYRQDPTRAEVAFLVADAFQGRGASTLLLHDLARRARAVGIRWFTAVVMAENIVMRDVFLRGGFPYRVVFDWPTILIELDIGQAVAPPPGRDLNQFGRLMPVA
ncbi:MAG: GNAT family N-acetyltransferase [Thermoplasmata archaeon]